MTERNLVRAIIFASFASVAAMPFLFGKPANGPQATSPKIAESNLVTPVQLHLPPERGDSVYWVAVIRLPRDVKMGEFRKRDLHMLDILPEKDSVMVVGHCALPSEICYANASKK